MVSDLVATPEDLALLLGREDVDSVRATLILRLAQTKCERYVSPLPASAQDIVLAVAVRAYANVNSATQAGLGSAYMTLAQTGQGGAGGLYVSKAERRELRLVAGRSGVFSVDMLPRGRSEVQAVIVEATAGTFTLSFRGETTTALAFDSTAAQVQSALEALSSIGAGAVSVEDGFTVLFKGDLSEQALPQVQADDSALTGIVTVVTVEQGQQPAWCG